MSGKALAPAIMAALGTVISVAQTAGPPDPRVITAVRPLKDVVAKLEAAYAKPVTYEEPIRVWRGDLKVVGKDENAKFGLLPKDRSFRLPMALGSPEAPALDAALVGKILDAYHAQNDGVGFQLLTSRYGLHIVPALVNGADGRLVPGGSLLDTVITIPRESRVPEDHVQALSDAVNASAATKMQAVPNLQFMQDFAPGGTVCPSGGMSFADYPGAPQPPGACSFEWGAVAVPARQALIDLLEHSSTTMTWKLLCQSSAQPQDRTCFLDVEPLVVTVPRADGSPRRHYLLYDRCATCPPPGRHLAPIEP